MTITYHAQVVGLSVLVLAPTTLILAGLDHESVRAALRPLWVTVLIAGHFCE